MQYDDPVVVHSAYRIWKSRASRTLRRILVAKRDGTPETLREVALAELHSLNRDSLNLRIQLVARSDAFAESDAAAPDHDLDSRLSPDERLSHFRHRTVEGASIGEVDRVLPDVFRLLGEAELFTEPRSGEPTTAKSLLLEQMRKTPINYFTMVSSGTGNAHEASFGLACQRIGELAFVKNERRLAGGEADIYVELVSTVANYGALSMAEDLFMADRRSWDGLAITYDESPEEVWAEFADELRNNPLLPGSSIGDA